MLVAAAQPDSILPTRSPTVCAPRSSQRAPSSSPPLHLPSSRGPSAPTWARDPLRTSAGCLPAVLAATRVPPTVISRVTSAVGPANAQASPQSRGVIGSPSNTGSWSPKCLSPHFSPGRVQLSRPSLYVASPGRPPSPCFGDPLGRLLLFLVTHLPHRVELLSPLHCRRLHVRASAVTPGDTR